MWQKIFQWFVRTWRGRIILLVVGVVLVGQFWLTWRIHRFTTHFCQATIAGTSLDHPDVVFVHQHLLDALKDELSEGYQISVRPYDAFAFEFLNVTHTAFVATHRQKRGLRLRFDPVHNVFHIVGYWTVE
jgi:hypothetical protein